MAATEPIRSKRQIRELAAYCLRRGQFRNHCLIVLGVHTALRVSDLLRLRREDVYDFERGCVRACIAIAEKKTGKTKLIALNKCAVRAISIYLSQKPAAPADFLFENPRTGKAISRIQAYRIIRAAAEALKLGVRVSCHSLRKTFGYHAWKSGVSPAVIMEIYNHSSFAVTRRYLGVSQDDKNEVYLRLNLSV
jgi:integrase